MNPVHGTSRKSHARNLCSGRAQTRRKTLAYAAVVGVLMAFSSAGRAASYDSGVSDTEIKIGSTSPFSGPASPYSAVTRAASAYFKQVNDAGGVNGRKIEFIAYDDGYSPPKAFEQVRRLLEDDKVLLIFGSIGTPSNMAAQAYLNQKHVPQLFLMTGSPRWDDPEHFPWTMGWLPSYRTESILFGRFIVESYPDAKVGILHQNDDAGRDFYKALRLGMGAKANQIVAQQTYEVSDPTVDQQVLALRESGATVFYNASTPRFASLAIRKAAEIGWRLVHLLPSVGASIASTFAPAGLENSKGIVSTAFLKDADDPEWANDESMNAWRAWMARYYPDGNLHDGFNVLGYTMAQSIVEVLKTCWNDLTRANVMKHAASLQGQRLPLMLPGIEIRTGPKDFAPIKQLQMQRFDGKQFVRFGPVLSLPDSR